MNYVQTTEGQVYTTNTPEHWTGCTILPASKGKDLIKQQACTRLRKLLKPKSTVYTILRHVSASGMFRRISVVIATKDGIADITSTVAGAMEYKLTNKQGIGVGGCGQDMGFNLVYNLGYTLWPKGTRKPHGTRNGVPDSDGGYALKQRWL